MVELLGMVPQDWYYISFSLLLFILIFVAIALAILSVLAIKGFIELQNNIGEGYEEIKKKFQKTFRIIDVFLDIFGDDEELDEDDDEEVYVRKKKKRK